MSTFKKLGKGVNDGLKLKYNFNRQLKIRTTTADGIQITTTGVSGKDGDFSGSVHGQVKVADVGTVKAELFTSGATEVTVEADKVAKGFVFRATGTDAPKLTADIEYTQDVFAGTLNFDVSKSTTVIGASGVVGFDGFAVGGEAKFDTKASELSDFNAAFEYSNGDFTGTIKTREKADNIDVSTFHKVNPDWTSGALCSYNFLSRNWKLTGLTSYILSDTTNIKAKADSTGMVATCLEQRVTGNNVLVRLSTEFNAKKHTTVPEKVGLSVFFGEGFTEKD